MFQNCATLINSELLEQCIFPWIMKCELSSEMMKQAIFTDYVIRAGFRNDEMS